MSKLRVIIGREYAQVVKKKSFLIGIILMPVFMVVITVLPALLAMKKSATTDNYAIIDLDGQSIGEMFSKKIEQYKLDDSAPAYEVTEILNLGPDDSLGLAKAQERFDSLLQEKFLKGYLVFYDNMENNDSCLMVTKSSGIRTSKQFDRSISTVLSELRLNKSEINLDFDSVMNLTRRVEFSQASPGGIERDFLTIYMGGLIFVMIIFVTIITYGQILMRSVIEEKNSRIIEVMVSSVSPFQLMAGKIIGMGLASLTQVGAWIVMGTVIFAFKGDLNIDANISNLIFDPIFICFWIIYLMLGYLLYSTLFALIGSLVNSEKEAANFMFPIIMVVMMPVMILMYVMREPDSTIVTVLSLIPFFTPTLMILRLNILGAGALTLGDPIVLQAALGVILTALTIVGIMWLAGRIFRIGILMYGKRPTLPEIVKWIWYK